MPLSRSRDYLSIGEVLDAVRPEFPDISISKIRFLEAEGLIAPERTASGYRKFYEQDVERLRYVLSLQKDHFLPLRVIKERLTGANGGSPPPAPPPSRQGVGPPETAEPQVETEVAAAPVSLDREALLASSGLSEQELTGLEEYGVVARGRDRYDETDLAIARAARGFLAHGVDARHLKMYRQAAEREASIFQQILQPTLRKGDPESLRRADETARELESLSRTLRGAFLRSSVRSLL